LWQNLQHADLDPIDTAGALVGFFQARHEEEGLDLDGIIKAMISLERDPERVKKEIAVTVTAIQKISMNFKSSLVRSCSLKTGITEQVDAFKKSDLEALLSDLRELIALVEGRLPEALPDEVAPASTALKHAAGKYRPLPAGARVGSCARARG
jgi:hypothetical protein